MYVKNIAETATVASLLCRHFMLVNFMSQIYLFWLNWCEIQFSLKFLLRLQQGLASSNFTIAQGFIMPRCVEIDGIYPMYLPSLYVVAVLDLQGHQERRV